MDADSRMDPLAAAARASLRNPGRGSAASDSASSDSISDSDPARGRAAVRTLVRDRDLVRARCLGDAQDPAQARRSSKWISHPRRSLCSRRNRNSRACSDAGPPRSERLARARHHRSTKTPTDSIRGRRALMLTREPVARAYALAAIFSAFLRASSSVPTYMNALSGRSSPLPSQIWSNDSIVSSSDDVTPLKPVNTSAT